MMATVTCLANATLCMIGLLAASVALAAWEQAKPVEFVVPAGTRDGARADARYFQGGAFGESP